MKNTKLIKIINVLGEKVTIDPIDYKTALKLVIEGEENSLLMDKICKLICEKIGVIDNPKEDAEIKELLNTYDKKKEELDSIRENLNYWYCGIDNLDTSDCIEIENKYRRKRTL